MTYILEVRYKAPPTVELRNVCPVAVMFANRSGLQVGTLRNIVLAWVLTLPACVLLGSLLFAASLFTVLRLAS